MGNDSQAVPPLRTGDTRKPAPDDLALVQGYVNSFELDGEEDFPDRQALERWLVQYELMSAGDTVTQADFDQAIDVREALRAVLKAANGGPEAPDAVAALNAVAKTAELLVRVGPDGTARLVPVRGGVDGAIARLLAIVQRSQVDGTWQRLKVCPDHDCGWAFYDWSKNRSATWCSMETCGNRAKARSYRERHRAHTH